MRPRFKIVVLAAAWVSLGIAPLEGPQKIRPLTVEGSRFELVEPIKGFAVPQSDIEAWIRAAARAVAGYYGKFTVPKLRIEILAEGSRPLGLGQAFRARLIQIRLGTDASASALQHDWSMTHEMFHLAFPDLDDNESWVQEGMATYLEPIARARVGQLKAADVQAEWKSRFPDGLPEPGDRGLNEAHDYRRIYWGGAIFWHFADVEIRRRTEGRKSIDDVFRAVYRAGAMQDDQWQTPQLLRMAEKATGTKVLAEMYEKAARHPFAPDLAQHWRELEPWVVEGILTGKATRPPEGMKPKS